MCHAELKVVHKCRAQHGSQTYRLSVYVFYPRELEAVQTNFFSHMFQTMRLHMPEVTAGLTFRIQARQDPQCSAHSVKCHIAIPGQQRHCTARGYESRKAVVLQSSSSAPAQSIAFTAGDPGRASLQLRQQPSSCFWHPSGEAVAFAFAFLRCIGQLMLHKHSVQVGQLNAPSLCS